MKLNILKNTCIRVDRDERQITRCKSYFHQMHESISESANTMSLVGNDVRLTILLLLQKESRLCVCDLSDVLGMKIPAVSQHLRKLKDAGIAVTQREGTVIYYLISENRKSEITRLLALLGRPKTLAR